jgi:hypothetical protein
MILLETFLSIHENLNPAFSLQCRTVPHPCILLQKKQNASNTWKNGDKGRGPSLEFISYFYSRCFMLGCEAVEKTTDNYKFSYNYRL